MFIKNVYFLFRFNQSKSIYHSQLIEGENSIEIHTQVKQPAHRHYTQHTMKLHFGNYYRKFVDKRPPYTIIVVFRLFVLCIILLGISI